MSNRLRILTPSPRIGDEVEDFQELPPGAGWSALCAGARIVWTPDGQPIRRIAPRSKRPVGFYNSRKTGLMLAHESRGHGHVGGEKLALMKCEIDPDVIDFRSQHIRFDAVIDGIPRSHIPDLIKVRRDGVIEIEEIKKDDRWKSDPDYRAMIEFATSAFAGIGWVYRVSTAVDLAATPRIRDNVVQIQSERWASFSDLELSRVLSALRAGGGLATLFSLKRALGGRPGIQAIVKAMMCRGHLRLPLDQRLDDAAVVQIVEPSLNHLRVGV